MQVVASAQGQCVGQAQGAVGEAFALQVPSANLWSPDNPFLYDLEVQLLGNQQGMVSMLAVVGRNCLANLSAPACMNCKCGSLKASYTCLHAGSCALIAILDVLNNPSPTNTECSPWSTV